MHNHENASRGQRSSFLEMLEPRRLFSGVIKGFTVTNLVSDGSVPASFTDANLKNPWGIAFNTALNVIWTGNNGTGTSSVYNTDGSPVNTGGLYSTITIPPPHNAAGPSTPTGMVFNTTKHFLVHAGSVSVPAAYIWATEDGTISAWNPAANATAARLEVDQSRSGSVFKGLAIASTAAGDEIFATDFANDKVDVFNAKFAAVNVAGAFTDPSIPSGFAPFGIQTIGSKVYVTYAKQDAEKHDDVAGVGNGFVDVFSTSGKLLEHVGGGGQLNSPWGVAQAPAGFGKLAGDVLVGNFGDGKILAFNPSAAKAGRFVGDMGTAAGHTLSTPGLWGMTFGDTAANADSLFITAGPNDEANGLLAVINT